MAQSYISMGSNMGDPMANLKKALQLISQTEGTEVTAVSSVFCTEPVGFEEQPWFYNCTIEIETSLSPTQLLSVLQAIETSLGRVRTIRWGPRVIDLDILIYEKYQSNDEQLTIPHPRMTERAFVMVPLQEIAGDLILTDGRTITEVVGKLHNIKKYTCIDEKLW